jgi:hypothetical protein
VTNNIYEATDSRQSTTCRSSLHRSRHSRKHIWFCRHSFRLDRILPDFTLCFRQVRFSHWSSQGSYLGPVLLALSVASFSCLIQSFDVRLHQQADDTLFYTAVAKSELSSKVARTEPRTANIHDQLLNNGLLLNPLDTNVIQLPTERGSADPLVRHHYSSLINHQAPWRHL